MNLNKNVLLYEKLDADLRKKVALKYLKDPQNSIIRIPNNDGSRLTDAIEVWHNASYHLVIVKEEDLKKIHWDAYLETGDDGMFLPFMDNENYFEFFDDGLNY